MAILDKFGLHGKVALVTGAGRNLGKKIAIAFAEAGADVAVTSRTQSDIDQTADKIREKKRNALALRMDVTDFPEIEQGVQRIIAELGRIDILVNNAAGRSHKSILDISIDEWRNVIETNLTGAFLCCKAVGPHMIRQGGGRIINISSRAGVRGRADFAAYCASKGGLNQLTRALALEWAPHNILVNAIAPGLLEIERNYTIPKERFSGFPLQRVANPLDIVPLAVYLASEACTYTTGEVIMVDGGVSIK